MTDKQRALLKVVRHATAATDKGKGLRRKWLAARNGGGWTAEVDDGQWHTQWQRGYAAGLRRAAILAGIPFEEVYGSPTETSG